MARPTSKEKLIFKIRDRKIVKMIDKGYPLPYISTFFNLSKGRLTQIRGEYMLREEKYAAQAAVTHAIRRGDLEPRACQNCGEISNVDAHHHKGYKEENWLKVIWLCRKHHSRVHVKMKKVDKDKRERVAA